MPKGIVGSRQGQQHRTARQHGGHAVKGLTFVRMTFENYIAWRNHKPNGFPGAFDSHGQMARSARLGWLFSQGDRGTWQPAIFPGHSSINTLQGKQ